MDYKEEYQKALERAKMILCNLPEGSSSTRDIETIFPELKESEDEKTRRGLISFLRSPFIKENLTDERVAPWIAYLEKQKYEYEVFEPVESTLEYKMGFKAGVESEKQKEPKDVSASTMTPGCWQGEEKSAEWSEEEKGILLECISALQNSSHWLLADKLSSLRPQPKQEWSEEDEKAINDLMWCIAAYRKGAFNKTHIEIANRAENWLKSRLPQPNTVSIKDATKFGNLEYERDVKDGLNHHWKPSKEQMETLKNCAYGIFQNGDGPALRKLYNDLEKLYYE